MVIHYIAEYKTEKDVRGLYSSPAGVEKMNYIIKTIENCGYDLNVFSTSRTMSKHHFYWIKKCKLTETSRVMLRSTFSASNKVFKILDRIWAKLQILWYGLFCVSAKDVILVYHERYYLRVIKLLKKMRHVKLIYEIEEIYTIAANCDSRDISREINGIKVADGYLFSNDILAPKLSLVKKPFLVSYGSYQPIERIAFPSEDGSIHVVYAGTLNPIKAGAVNAILTAEYLNEHYHLHILGFGNEKELQIIQKEINRISYKTSCKVTYDGCLNGEKFNLFLQTCHIGLNTQNPKEALNDYSFPSKILKYLANGLFVIATSIAVLEKSSIASQIVLVEDDSPVAIANAIKKAGSFDFKQSRQILKRLDCNFINEFKLLMQRVLGE